MATNLIHFKTYNIFNGKKLSANEENTQYTVGVNGSLRTGTPEISYQAICWIKDTQQIWTHGQLYGVNSDDYVNKVNDLAEADGLSDISGTTYALPNTSAEDWADYCLATTDMLQDVGGSNVELISIAADLSSVDSMITIDEARSIVNAYNAGKLIAIKCGSKLRFGRGYFIPNIFVSNQGTAASNIFMSGILADTYFTHTYMANFTTNLVSSSTNMAGTLTLESA